MFLDERVSPVASLEVLLPCGVDANAWTMNVPSSSRATRAVFHDLSDRHVGTVHSFHVLPFRIFSTGFCPNKQRREFVIRPCPLAIFHARLLSLQRSRRNSRALFHLLIRYQRNEWLTRR
jgi:hypothetical protein